MIKCLFTLLFSFLILFSSNTFSQVIELSEEQKIELSMLHKKTPKAPQKETKRDMGGRFSDKPVIEMSYGISRISLEGMQSNFADAGALELKLGYSTQRKSGYGKNVLRYLNGFSFLSLASTDLNSKENTFSGHHTQTWQFGAGWKDGYGVELGKTAIMPYTSGALQWSRFNFLDNTWSLSSNDRNLIDNFNEDFRFGTFSESGINLQIVPFITLQGKYERAIVFPRHLFAKQMGSMLVETIGSGLIGEFIDNVLESSPVAGTLVNFILRSGYSYGIYELRQSEMNWPFGGEAPLSYDTYKIGMTFTF